MMIKNGHLSAVFLHRKSQSTGGTYQATTLILLALLFGVSAHYQTTNPSAALAAVFVMNILRMHGAACPFAKDHSAGRVVCALLLIGASRSGNLFRISFKSSSHFLDWPPVLAQNGRQIGIQPAELVRLVSGKGWVFGQDLDGASTGHAKEPRMDQ